MTPSDWQAALQALRQSDPSLQSSPSDEEPTDQSLPPDDPPQPRLDIILERKGRAGKTATIISGWTLPQPRLLQIASNIKQQLGAGGSARGGDILIQGDRRTQIAQILTSLGYKSRII